MKQVSQLNQDGYFVSVAVAEESPLEQGVYLIPGGAVDALPPKVPEGQRAKWDSGEWVFEDIPVPEPEPEPEPIDVIQQRISELKQLLVESDYKVLPDYDKQEDDIKVMRQAWRDEIRTLEQLNEV